MEEAINQEAEAGVREVDREGANGAVGGNPNGERENPSGGMGEREDPESDEQIVLTKDELQKRLQAEADKRVNQALASYRDRLLEGRAEREREFLEREKNLAHRELELEAKKTLMQRGLPEELLPILNFSGDEACRKSIDAVEAAVREAVGAEMNERLRGGAPRTGVSGNAGGFRTRYMRVRG